MKLLKVEVENFGSYKHLELDLENIGLTLIHGKTGSGKSTIPDMACWILFGVTAKGGSVDDVRSWQAPDEATKGTASIETQIGTYKITRIRGKAGQNDLYWQKLEETYVYRGKDLLDSQKLLQETLGVSYDLYVTGSYFHEFSDTGSFFLRNNKSKRDVLERVANVDLSIALAMAASNERKIVKEHLETSYMNLGVCKTHILKLISLINNTEKRLEEFHEKQEQKSFQFEEKRRKELATIAATVVNLTQNLIDPIELEKQYEELNNNNQCKSCGQLVKLQELNDIKQKILTIRRIKADLINLKKEHQRWSTEINPYSNQDENPFIEQLTDLQQEAAVQQQELDGYECEHQDLSKSLAALNLLYDLSFELRGQLLQRAVQEIQEETNRYLETYFDSEIRIAFELKDADSLDVTIHKNGYECNYKQLSKGQRGLLKLCFVVSVMSAASNNAGVHFDNLWFDEALDGLDSDLKIKAFDLLQELSTKHGSIMVIEHDNEFQNLFDNKYCVIIEGDISNIEKN